MSIELTEDDLFLISKAIAILCVHSEVEKDKVVNLLSRLVKEAKHVQEN